MIIIKIIIWSAYCVWWLGRICWVRSPGSCWTPSWWAVECWCSYSFAPRIIQSRFPSSACRPQLDLCSLARVVSWSSPIFSPSWSEGTFGSLRASVARRHSGRFLQNLLDTKSKIRSSECRTAPLTHEFCLPGMSMCQLQLGLSNKQVMANFS